MKLSAIWKCFVYLSLTSSLASSIAQAGMESAVHFVRLQANKTNPLFGYSVGPGSQTLDKPILKPFSTDGCSQSPNSYEGQKIVECCVAHDVSYWLGGTQDQKDKADYDFEACVSKKSGPVVAEIYFRGVRVGGGANGINTFRWGYGWDTNRSYSPITDSEWQQAERLHGKNLVELKTMLEEKSYQINFELLTLDMLSYNRTYDDELVYYYLRNKLKRNDVITFGQKLHFGSRSFFYRVRLKSCGENVIDFKIDHWNGWKTFVFRNVSIHNRPWSQLEKYILDVRDPSGCLM
jgi:hypothetical protein